MPWTTPCRTGKRTIGSAILALSLTVFANAGERCQILDNPYDPVFRTQAGLIPRSRVERGKKTMVMELDADWEMGFVRLAWGEADVHARMRNSMFIGSGGIALPDQVASLALDLGWTLRLDEGKALQLRVKPGLYGDLNSLDSRGWHTPFSGGLVRAFHPTLSGIVGLEVRPGFARTLMPIVGLKWEPVRQLGIEPRLPRSRIVWFPTPEWSAYGIFEWRNDSYTLDDSRRLITLQDFRILGGLAHRLSDRMELSLEAGRVFDREIGYRRRGGARYDVAQALFARVGIGGPF